jgi:hypothetical protein
MEYAVYRANYTDKVFHGSPEQFSLDHNIQVSAGYSNFCKAVQQIFGPITTVAVTYNNVGPESKVGDKCMFIFANEQQIRWGNCDDPNGRLVENETYEIVEILVFSMHTKIVLKGFEDYKFPASAFMVLD